MPPSPGLAWALDKPSCAASTTRVHLGHAFKLETVAVGDGQPQTIDASSSVASP
jgi:hypothetical protein